MKKLLLFILTVFSISVQAETFQLRKVMICDEKEKVIQTLAQNFEEFPIWSGSSDGGTVISMFVNKTNGSYTLVEYDGVVACVISVGNTKIISI